MSELKQYSKKQEIEKIMKLMGLTGEMK